MKTMTLAAIAALSWAGQGAAQEAAPLAEPAVEQCFFCYAPSGRPTWLAMLFVHDLVNFTDLEAFDRVGPKAAFVDTWAIDLADGGTLTITIEASQLRAPNSGNYLALFADAGTVCEDLSEQTETRPTLVCDPVAFATPALAVLHVPPHKRAPATASIQVENLPPGRFILRLRARTTQAGGSYRGTVTAHEATP